MNICSWLQTNSERWPDKAALIYEDRQYSHSQLFSSVRRFGNALKSLGVVPGERVALFMPNCPEFLIARWGAIAIGAAAAPLNMMFQKNEVRYVLNNAAPRVMVTIVEKLDLIEDLWIECPSLEHIVVIDGPNIHGTCSLRSLLDRSSEDLVLHDCQPDDLCDLYYTSGTTGRPKGVMCSHSSFSHLLKYESIVWQMRTDDLVLVVLPLFHTKGLIIPNLLATYNGATQFLMQRWDTQRVLDTIQEKRITVFVGVPTMLAVTVRGVMVPAAFTV